ncbi:MAG: glycoside hydrolase family 57 protein [Candidatus Saccharimonas sp.]|nr:glycoside hydrolase family 57 protein [Candidatus Saccharimonas sp.]
MKSVVLYLHVHQPYRISPYSVFSAGYDHDYFDDSRAEKSAGNEVILKKVALKSYIPTNKMLLELLTKYPEFRLSLSITGTFIEQCEAWAPDVLDSFKKLVATGRVEIVGETYHHSLAFFYSRNEFERQVQMHRDKIKQLFGVTPLTFRNTELAYYDEIGTWADEAGYMAVLAEGWDPVLGWRSPNYVYRPPQTNNVKLLLKNYRLSDDIAFRFSDRDWHEWPLSVDKYMSWLPAEDEQVINLFMDYETFGEHQWGDSGIFEFMRGFVERVCTTDWYDFKTVTEAATLHAKDTVSMPHTVTWADTERDLSAWLGNAMQQEAMRCLYELEDVVLDSNDTRLIDDWRKLQTSDHAYYMCTKYFRDGDVHAYFSPYSSPYDAFLYYMNALRDMRWRILEHHKSDSA